MTIAVFIAVLATFTTTSGAPAIAPAMAQPPSLGMTNAGVIASTYDLWDLGVDVFLTIVAPEVRMAGWLTRGARTVRVVPKLKRVPPPVTKLRPAPPKGPRPSPLGQAGHRLLSEAVDLAKDALVNSSYEILAEAVGFRQRHEEVGVVCDLVVRDSVRFYCVLVHQTMVPEPFTSNIKWGYFEGTSEQLPGGALLAETWDQ